MRWWPWWPRKRAEQEQPRPSNGPSAQALAQARAKLAEARRDPFDVSGAVGDFTAAVEAALASRRRR